MFNRKDEAQMLYGKEPSGLISANDYSSTRMRVIYGGKRSLL